MADYSSIPDIQVGEDADAIDAWWDATFKLYKNDRESFNAYVADNPEMGVRWHARAADDEVNTGTENGIHHQAAQTLSYQIANDLGYGADMKQDGKMVAWNYDDWNDINNEWGAGDFWKIGTPSSLPGGLNDFLEDNPFQVAAMIGSVFIPTLAPLVAQALTVSNTVAAGLLSAGMTAAGGGDLTDIVTAGMTAYGLGELSAFADAKLATLADHPQTATALDIIAENGGAVAEQQAAQDPNMIMNFATDAVGHAEDFADMGGFGAAMVAGELNNAYNDYMGGTVPPIGSGTYDNPLLDYPGTLPSNPDAGGQTTQDGQTQGNEIVGEDGMPPTPLPNGEQYSEEALAEWENRTPEVKEWWNSLSDEQRVAMNNAAKQNESQTGGLLTDPNDSPTGIELDAEKAPYRWNGTQLINTVTGAIAGGNYSNMDMQSNVDYNVFGEPLGEPEQQDTDSGLVFGGGDVAYNPDTGQAYDDTLRTSQRETPLDTLYGSDYAVIDGVLTYVGGNPSGSTNAGHFGTTGTGDPNAGGGSNDPGAGSGGGGEPGDGTGTGNEPGGQPGDPTTSIDPFTGLPFIVGDPNHNSAPTGSVPPQDMSTNYVKPEWDSVEQRPLLETRDPYMRAPMVTPAANSGQPGYDEWLEDYLKDPTTQQGLLPMISGKQTNGGLL